jgi:uncharacterized membrane protein
MPPHKFSSVDDVRGAVKDPLCKNMVSCFLERFWAKGGWAIASDMDVAGTQEVTFGAFAFVLVCSVSFCLLIIF